MRTTGRIQVLSCGCICRTYDGRIVVVNEKCSWHRCAVQKREAVSATSETGA